MFNSQLTKYAYGYLGATQWKRQLDLFMWLAIGAVLPGALVRLAGGDVLLTVAVCVLGWALVALVALLIRQRMREIVRTLPQDAAAWDTPGDSDTLK